MSFILSVIFILLSIFVLITEPKNKIAFWSFIILSNLWSAVSWLL